MRKILFIILFALIAVLAHSQTRQAPMFVPKEGFVPDATTAQIIAEAVLIPIYGKETVLSERPFKAILKGNFWIITGSVRCEAPTGAVCPGGAAEVKISKKSGQILSVSHYQ